MFWFSYINPLNAELNPIWNLLALLGAHPILHVSRIRVKHCTMCIPVCTNKTHYIFYCSILKSTDLINLENACEYFANKSLLVVGKVPPLGFI